MPIPTGAASPQMYKHARPIHIGHQPVLLVKKRGAYVKMTAAGKIGLHRLQLLGLQSVNMLHAQRRDFFSPRLLGFFDIERTAAR